MQTKQAGWLVTRNLLTSSGEGSKENVSIKEDKLGKLHSIEPHRHVFLQMVSLLVWLFPMKVNLITRKLFPAMELWKTAPFLCTVSNKHLFPLWMSLPSTFTRKKAFSRWHSISVKVTCTSQVSLGGGKSLLFLFLKFMTNIGFMFLKLLRCFLQLENLFSRSQTILTVSKFWNLFQIPYIITIIGSSFLFIFIISISPQ